MTEPNWMPYENGMPGLDAGLDDVPVANPTRTRVDAVTVAPLTVVDEYEAITDPAFTEARFAPGGDLEYVQEGHRDLFRQPLLTGSRWECVTRARSVNSERARLGKLETEGSVVVRQRTATYTAWSVVPEEEWPDAEVPL